MPPWWRATRSFATDCAAIFGCGMPYDSKDGIPSRDVAAAKAMLKEAGVDLTKPLVMLHVANAPGIAPWATSRAKRWSTSASRSTCRPWTSRPSPRAGSTPSHERRRLEPRSHDQFGARPGQSAQQPLPGGPGTARLRLGLADRSQDRGAAAEIRHGGGRSRAQGHRRRDPGPRLRAGALSAAGAVHDAVGLAEQSRRAC